VIVKSKRTSTAVDLTLDKQVRRWKKPKGGVKRTVCPGSADFDFTSLAAENTEVLEIPQTGLEFLPESFILGWTVERIKLPHESRIAARVEGKSSLARLGIGVHVTAPTIHAGFGYSKDGGNGLPIQLEIWNVGPLTVELLPGLPICQLIFEEVHGTPEKGYEGMFMKQGPQGPTPVGK
jgi:dCTP deaminase